MDREEAAQKLVDLHAEARAYGIDITQYTPAIALGVAALMTNSAVDGVKEYIKQMEADYASENI